MMIHICLAPQSKTTCFFKDQAIFTLWVPIEPSCDLNLSEAVAPEAGYKAPSVAARVIRVSQLMGRKSRSSGKILKIYAYADLRDLWVAGSLLRLICLANHTCNEHDIWVNSNDFKWPHSTWRFIENPICI